MKDELYMSGLDSNEEMSVLIKELSIKTIEHPHETKKKFLGVTYRKEVKTLYEYDVSFTLNIHALALDTPSFCKDDLIQITTLPGLYLRVTGVNNDKVTASSLTRSTTPYHEYERNGEPSAFLVGRTFEEKS